MTTNATLNSSLNHSPPQTITTKPNSSTSSTTNHTMKGSFPSTTAVAMATATATTASPNAIKTMDGTTTTNVDHATTTASNGTGTGTGTSVDVGDATTSESTKTSMDGVGINANTNNNSNANANSNANGNSTGSGSGRGRSGLVANTNNNNNNNNNVSAGSPDTSLKSAGLELERVWERCEGVGASRVGFKWMKELGYAIDRFDKAASSYLSKSLQESPTSPSSSSSSVSLSSQNSTSLNPTAATLPQPIQPLLRMKEDAERYILPFLKAGDQNCDWCCKKWRAHAKLLRAVPLTTATMMSGPSSGPGFESVLVAEKKAGDDGLDKEQDGGDKDKDKEQEKEKEKDGNIAQDNETRLDKTSLSPSSHHHSHQIVTSNSNSMKPADKDKDKGDAGSPEPEYRYLPFAAAQLGSNTIFTPLDAYEDDDEDDGNEASRDSSPEQEGKLDEEDYNDEGGDGDDGLKQRGGRVDQTNRSPTTATLGVSRNQFQSGTVTKTYKSKGKGKARASNSTAPFKSQPNSPTTSGSMTKKRKAVAEGSVSPKRARMGDGPQSRSFELISGSATGSTSNTAPPRTIRPGPHTSSSKSFPSSKTKTTKPLVPGKKFTFTRAEKGPGLCTRCVKYGLVCVRDGPFGVKGACGNCRTKRRRCILAPAGTEASTSISAPVPGSSASTSKKKGPAFPTRTSKRRSAVVTNGAIGDDDDDDDDHIPLLTSRVNRDRLSLENLNSSPLSSLSSESGNLRRSPRKVRMAGVAYDDDEDEYEEDDYDDGEEIEEDVTAPPARAFPSTSAAQTTAQQQQSSRPVIFTSKCQRCIDANVDCIQTQPGWPCDMCSMVRKGCVFPGASAIVKTKVREKEKEILETENEVEEASEGYARAAKRRVVDRQDTDEDVDETSISTAKRRRASGSSLLPRASATVPKAKAAPTRASATPARTTHMNEEEGSGEDVSDTESVLSDLSELSGPSSLAEAQGDDGDMDAAREEEEVAMDLDFDEEKEQGKSGEKEVKNEGRRVPAVDGIRAKNRPFASVHVIVPPMRPISIPTTTTTTPSSTRPKPLSKKPNNPRRCQRCNALDLECVPAVTMKASTGICSNCREHRRKCSFSIGKARPPADGAAASTAVSTGS
ncbi:hypothetical protein K435DRAFT_278884 [Dendrothele bispora CBS 962.96]|uniref:Zn(2)-C6 fungal-type domain-containing protein n=1 Tax=Dendrothele bispora (strain CBS 962.96) TaxID=1314807 RepID=A0A4S8MLS9_DENBC|nr:hypothetical protein K435DRAFT_278884 [Dendrothele bispora CBS 962.96]